MHGRGSLWGKVCSVFGRFRCPQLARVHLPLYIWTCVCVYVRTVWKKNPSTLHTFIISYVHWCNSIMYTHMYKSRSTHALNSWVWKFSDLACYGMFGFFGTAVHCLRCLYTTKHYYIHVHCVVVWAGRVRYFKISAKER